MFKTEQRKSLLQNRDLLPRGERETASEIICSSILEMPLYQKAEDILCYVSFRSEVNTERLLRHSLLTGKRVFCPKVLGKRKMEFYQINAWEDLIPGAFGIPEPGICTEERRYPYGENKPCCMVVPGAGFDLQGYRLGYGGGYYDTYLAANPVRATIGICFAAQLVEKIATEPTDRKVDYIVTEKGVYKSV